MAAETFELYSLTSRLALDTSQFDRAYSESQRKMRTLAGDAKHLETAMKSGGGGVDTFGGALQSLFPSLSGLGGPTGAIGIVTAGVGAMLTALTAAAVGVWEITSRFSDLGSQLEDMSAQVNLSVETLGTFQGVGKAVGVEVEQLSTGLVTFQKNLAGGNDALKALGVTSKDNETALRQTFEALAKVNDKTLQTALAQEIFGKSGKAMLAIIKETGGNIDAAQEKLRKWNYLMSDDAIAIADQFGDKLAELGMRFQGIANTIATETAPAFIAAFEQISAALDANTIEWKWWGEQVGNIIVGATGVLAGFLTAVESMSIAGGPSVFIIVWKEAMDKAIEEMNAKRREVLQGAPEGSGGGRVPGPTVNWKPGGDKKEREAREKEDPIIRLMERYEQQIDSLTPKTEEQRAQEELLNEEYAKSSERQKALVLTLARTVDAKRALQDASEKQARQQQIEAEALESFMSRQAEALRQIKFGDKSAVDEFNDFRVAFHKLGGVLTETREHWLRFDAMLIQSAEHARLLLDTLRDVANTTPPIAPGGIPKHTGPVFDDSGLGPPPPEDPMAKWRRMADDLSGDLTYTIDRAIQRGFEDGMAAGVKEFGLGILEMARHEALDALRRAIRSVLGGSDEEGGGGGIFGTLLGFGLRALGGLFGGGAGPAGGVGTGIAGAIGGKAGGGFVFPNEWSWVGERGPELVKAGSSGMSVLSNRDSTGMMGRGGDIYMTVYAQDAPSFARRETQTQIKNRMRREMSMAA